MRVGKRLGLGFGDASGFSEYFGLPALAVALDNTIVADNATVGTVVGEFNADGVTIVGASPFVIVGRELRVNSALTAGEYSISVQATGFDPTTIVIFALTPNFLLEVEDNIVLEDEDNIIIEVF